MLHEETVEASTLALIRQLLADEKLADFYLVGGTALFLKLGHRISIDIDLFIGKDFDSAFVCEHLKAMYRLTNEKRSRMSSSDLSTTSR
ncbi:Nucleotidyl transferase AbiEii toxin, Type IV TA system [Dyadobacter sp. SG02]|uniref:nucleotidyl transferase AbiEii/AbiGii toxin family protein n=1 Tax=Dyadobacter sp. SG02 TaxID=1855291 RepID=UPI0008D40777|nr:nucleotidyl transferase AbiEii/AbiGii toxin family protein [Dyadobacter sp. SG02]SEJ32924.1 Nucleotidyl transferase AbiEii toxin, Type IV TA system [Dyadobacter sp. SG02]